nr:MAG TPA: hypothetical protein [Inoviridae sp.]
MLIQNTDIYSTFWNLVIFIIQFLTDTIPFFLLFFVLVFIVSFIFKILTFQK